MRFRFNVIDPKLRRNLPRYVLQCSLVALALLVVLSIEDTFSRAVVIAAIGSTAFILFIMPHSESASPRHVLGGHFIALSAGSVASLFESDVTFLFAVEGALAVGAAIFLMAATNTEHAPAAGTALGVVAHGFSWSLAVLLIASVAMLVATHQLFRSNLRDLY